MDWNALQQGSRHVGDVPKSFDWKTMSNGAESAARIGRDAGSGAEHDIDELFAKTNHDGDKENPNSEDNRWAQMGSDAFEFLKSNRTTILIPFGVAAGAATGGLLMGPILGAIGFSSIGPVAGSLAAGMQSAGTAGAVFSTVQSAAMGGYGVTAVAGFFAGTGAAAGAAAGVTAKRALGTEDDAPSDQDHNGDVPANGGNSQEADEEDSAVAVAEEL